MASLFLTISLSGEKETTAKPNKIRTMVETINSSINVNALVIKKRPV